MSTPTVKRVKPCTLDRLGTLGLKPLYGGITQDVIIDIGNLNHLQTDHIYYHLRKKYPGRLQIDPIRDLLVISEKPREKIDLTDVTKRLRRAIGEHDAMIPSAPELPGHVAVPTSGRQPNSPSNRPHSNAPDRAPVKATGGHTVAKGEGAHNIPPSRPESGAAAEPTAQVNPHAPSEPSAPPSKSSPPHGKRNPAAVASGGEPSRPSSHPLPPPESNSALKPVTSAASHSPSGPSVPHGSSSSYYGGTTAIGATESSERKAIQAMEKGNGKKWWVATGIAVVALAGLLALRSKKGADQKTAEPEKIPDQPLPIAMEPKISWVESVKRNANTQIVPGVQR